MHGTNYRFCSIQIVAPCLRKKIKKSHLNYVAKYYASIMIYDKREWSYSNCQLSISATAPAFHTECIFYKKVDVPWVGKSIVSLPTSFCYCCSQSIKKNCLPPHHYPIVCFELMFPEQASQSCHSPLLPFSRASGKTLFLHPSIHLIPVFTWH